MKNQKLIIRSVAAVWHPCTQMKHHENYPLLPIERGKGAWLYDFEGKRYLDAVSSWWVNLFGHCNPRINSALIGQLEQLEHVMIAGLTHEPVVCLSERLAQLTGLGHAFYGSDGSSATEIALKMSFHYWLNSGYSQKTKFVSLQNSYHGETIGALAVTDLALFKDTYAPLLRQNVQLVSPDSRLAAATESAESYAERCAEQLEQYLKEHHTETAALILEPLVQAASGMGMYSEIYLKRSRELCDRYAVHLIADEIAVGFGRTGTMFAFEQAEIRPDFICLSKGLSGGYLPLSAVLTTDDIFQAFYDDRVTHGFLHSHSYTGNALACRAALATLDIFEQDNVLVQNREKAALLTDSLASVEAHPSIKSFRHLGMIWAFDVSTDDPQFSLNFYRAALKLGLFVRPIGNTVYLMPPYVIGEEEIALLAESLPKLINQIALQ